MKWRYRIVLMFILLVVGGFFLQKGIGDYIIKQHTQYNVQNEIETSIFGDIFYALGIAIMCIYYYIITMIAISILGYIISKFWLKQKEITKGFQITNFICLLGVIGLITAYLIETL